MNESRENLEIDLKRMVVVLWSNLWIILLVTALLGGMAFGYAWFSITPTYSASTQMYVNNNYPDSPGYSASQLTAAQELADTYIVIMRSRPVLDAVAEKTGLPYSYGQLRGMISAGTVNNTEIFEVTVTCTNYQHATIIANAIADVLPEKVPAVVDTASVRLVQYAVENPNPIGPNYTKYAILGGAIGFALAAFVIVVAELMNTTINSDEYLSVVYKSYPLLAVIPGTENPKAGYRGYYRGNYEGKSKKDKKNSADKKPADNKSGGAK